MKDKYGKIVIDAANILHNDTGIEMIDEDGQRRVQSRPERLKDCMSFCEKKGWKVTAFLKQSTYEYAVSVAKSKSNTTVGDVNILDNLIEQDKLHLIAAEKEDIYWIDYAVAENALIVTHDKFRNEMKEYQDRDWKDINKRTLRDFKFVNNKFILPSLKKKQVTKKQNKEQITLDQIFTAIQKLNTNVAELERYVRKREFTNLKKSQNKPKTKQQQIKSNLEIVNTVVNSLLSSGNAVVASHIQSELARPILGLDENIHEWKAGWSEDLREILGYSKTGGFPKWLISNSKKKIVQQGNKLSYA